MNNIFLANSFDALPNLSMFLGLGFFGIFSVFLLVGIVILAIMALKGYALWNSARRGETVWFIVLLLVNTMGILELIYLIFIVKKWPKIYSGDYTQNSANTSSTDTNKPNTPTT